VPRAGILASAFFPHIGGVEELVRQLGHALGDLGGQPTIFTNRWPASLPPHEIVEGLTVYRFAFRAPDGGIRGLGAAAASNPLTLARYVRALRDERCELIHVQCVSTAAWFALQASRILRVPLVVTLQGELTMDATALYERSRSARHTLRQLLRHADAITACSQATLTDAERWAGYSFGPRARVIHNGVRVADFADAVPHYEGVKYVFGVGRHVRQKGFDVLLEAAAVLTRDPEFHHRVLLAGDGPERGPLERRAKELGLGDSVRFLGATGRAETAELFRGASVFVLPSRQEPFGIVNLEAMAAGTPVVATAVGGVPEFVANGATGILVKPGDPQALANAIRESIVEPARAAERIRSGAQVARQHDWSVIAEHYVDVYRSVTHRELR
jgi:glycogen synthase